MKQAYPPSFDWDYDADHETGSMPAADSEFSESVIERAGTRVKITENFFARFTTLIIIGSFAAILLSGVYYLFWHPSASDAPYDEEIEAKLAAQERQIQAIQAKIAREKKAEQNRLAKKAEGDTDNQTRQVPIAQNQSSQVQQAHQSDQSQQNQVRRHPAEQAEQERLARIEQARQEEQARLARIEQAQREEQERLARIEQAQQAEQARQARIERERLAQQQQAELALIADLVSDGRNAWQRQDYGAARKYYDTALKKVTASAFKTERRFIDYKNEIEAALKDEDIIYGAKGYIKYQNRWMSPQDYETALFQEGYVKYRGELIHYTSLRATIKQVTEPDVNMYLIMRYKGQRVHTKNIQFRRIVLNRSTDQSSEYTA